MSGFKRFILLIARLLISLIFILSAVNKIFNWQKTETAFINLFCDWQSFVSFSPALGKLFSVLITWVPEILIVVTIVELVAALLVFFGIKEKVGAFFLIIFFMPATILLHPFWFLSGAKRDFQMVMFLKNIAILGGLLFLMIFGTKVKSNFQTVPIMPKSDEIDEN
jgi:putative oxidoreductase